MKCEKAVIDAQNKANKLYFHALQHGITLPPIPKQPENICQLMCYSGVVSNVLQKSHITASTKCSNEDFDETKLRDSMESTVTQAMSTKEDVAGQALSLLQSNKQKIVDTLVNTVKQAVKEIISNNYKTDTVVVNKVLITGRSFYIDQLFQTVKYNRSGAMNDLAESDDSIKQSSDYAILQLQVHKSDTVGDLAQNFLNTIDTGADMLDNVFGFVLIIIGCALASIILIVLALYVYNQKVRTYLDQLLGNNLELHPKPK